MSLAASVIAELADIVDDAQRNAADIVKLTENQPDMDLADGYAVQAELCRRWQADGRRLTLHVGGGITWKSDAAAEWDETVVKARGPLQAIGGMEGE